MVIIYTKNEVIVIDDSESVMDLLYDQENLEEEVAEMVKEVNRKFTDAANEELEFLRKANQSW